MFSLGKSKSLSASAEAKKEEKQVPRSVSAPTKTVTIADPKKDIKADGVEKKGAKETKSDATVSTPTVSKEAVRALMGGIMDAILDIRVSSTEAQEQDLSRNGYLQLLQEGAKKSSSAASSTFGNKSSVWVWRRHQGTCSGRLKPVIDIILDPSSVSSELVLAGYTCDPVQITGQNFWIKRATNEEEEKDAIIDLYVSSGKMKDPSDSIWQSPGVGWVRVDGNFSKSMFSSIDTFLWYRPARTRAFERQMINPLKGAVALTEDIRQTKLIAAVRIALRHYIPVQDIKRLATLTMENNQLNVSASVTDTIRSERMMDFSSLFHHYCVKGQLSFSKWSKMLADTGLRLKSLDSTQAFNYFDINHNGAISIEEFTSILGLTDYELDLALDKIRLKLLLPCVPREVLKAIPLQTKDGSSTSLGASTMKTAHAGVIGGQILHHPYIGKNKIREALTLMQIFNTVNIKKDSILSLDEMMDLATRVEVFLTEEEARKLLSMMDINGDDRVEEADFISYMRRESDTNMKKAFRLKESANYFRRWLVRGTSEKIQNTNTATASKQQWKWFKVRYEKSMGQKFPGFLSAPVLQSTLLSLGIRLSSVEAREFTLFVAPEKAGRVHMADLHSFMGRSCRSIGELVALVERDIFHELVDAYRAHSNAIKVKGSEDSDLANLYRKKLDEIQKFIENVYVHKAEGEAGGDSSGGKKISLSHDDDDEPIPVATMAVQPSLSQEFSNRRVKGSHEVISIPHLRSGIQELATAKKIPENLFPNLEEFVCLTVLVDADVTEGDIYGVKLKNFLGGLCHYIVTANEETKLKAGEKVSLEIISRELKLQIYREAKATSKTKKPDYKNVFDLFDENKNGTISLDEFRSMLKKLQLVSSLSDHQIPALLTMFDRGKKGVISFEDFKYFAEEGEKIAYEQDDYIFNQLKKAGISSSSGGGGGGKSIFDDDFDELTNEDLEGEIDIISDIPPTAITRNTDCDWLLWFFYRQACRIEPMDPEAVIIELESFCQETAMTTNTQEDITIKELWNLLFEIHLQGNITKPQFLKGIQLFTLHGNQRDDDIVDYHKLCAGIIRMGRSYNALIQEKRKEIEKTFPSLLQELKKYFKQLCEEHTHNSASGEKPADDVPRFEKIFRRIDIDGDGMITPREFKLGLKRLHYKDYKNWTMMMIRRLFDECDKNKDGLLSIKEFVTYILDKNINDLKRTGSQEHHEGKRTTSKAEKHGKDALGGKSGDLLNLSDEDDEEDDFFRKKRSLTDHELMRKVNEILMDVVPDEYPNNPQKHLEMIRASVRRFFQKSDPEYKGYVSEERFRAFLRRSGLQDRLTANEIRRFTDKLKRKGTGKERYENLIEYEKLCQQLLVVTESIPKSKAEVVFTRLQDAAVASSTARRAFADLCSLSDLHFTGFITKEELIHIAKMMDYPMTMYDVEALCELLPNHAVSKDGRSIDYRLLNQLLQTYSPRDQFLHNLDNHSALNQSFHQSGQWMMNQSGALPAYATPSGPSRSVTSLNDPLLRNSNNFIATPFGHSISSPHRGIFPPASPWDAAYGNHVGLPPGTPQLGSALAQQLGGNNTVYEKILKSLAERIRYAIQERNLQMSVNASSSAYSLRKRLENNDVHNSGSVTVRTLQFILEELGIILASQEIQIILTYYGKVNEPDAIFYDSFCRLIENTAVLGMGGVGGGGDLFENVPNPSGGGGVPVYFQPKVLMKYKEMKEYGKDLLEMFEFYDVDRKGKILSNKFKEVIVKTQLLQSELQLVKAMEDFSNVMNRSYIEYYDFCQALDAALARYMNARNSDVSFNPRDSRNNNRIGIAGGDDDYYGRPPSSRPSSRGRGTVTYSNDIDSGYGNQNGHYDYALSPPKVTDSLQLRRYSTNSSNSGPSSPRSSYDRGAGGMMSPNTRRSGNNGGVSNSKDLIQVPRTSPSKVGTKIWGNETPLSKKGRLPTIDDESKWCCAVCLYVENPINSDRCLVCDSPNYAMRKDYQVKEQCRNCTFLNGQFAEECEMCGEPLSHSRKVDKENKSHGNKDNLGAPSSHRNYRYSDSESERYYR